MHEEVIKNIKMLDKLALAAKQASLIPVEAKFRFQEFRVPAQKVMRHLFRENSKMKNEDMMIWLLSKISHMETKHKFRRDTEYKYMVMRAKKFDEILKG
jgi:hypothetical protein